MTCAYGHTFQPFERSRDLFCTACGLVKAVLLSRSPATSNPKSVGSKAETSSPTMGPLDASATDPYRDQALSIMQEAKHNPDFEEQLAAIFERNDLPPEMARDMFDEALSFGPGLDLKHFEETIIKPLAAVRIKDAEPTLDEDLDNWSEA